MEKINENCQDPRERLLNRWQKHDFYFFALKHGLNWQNVRLDSQRKNDKNDDEQPEDEEKINQALNDTVKEDELEISANIASYLVYLRENNIEDNFQIDPIAKWFCLFQKFKAHRNDYRNEWTTSMSKAIEIKMNMIGENDAYYKVYEILRILLYSDDIPLIEKYDNFTLNILVELMEDLSSVVNDPEILKLLEFSEDYSKNSLQQEQQASEELLKRFNSLPLFRNLKYYLDPFDIDNESKNDLNEVLLKISSKLEELDRLESEEGEAEKEEEEVSVMEGENSCAFISNDQ